MCEWKPGSVVVDLADGPGVPAQAVPGAPADPDDGRARRAGRRGDPGDHQLGLVVGRDLVALCDAIQKGFLGAEVVEPGTLDKEVW